ncbi:hypothetical protein [Faecalispora jeddahensis]|uniref:hypothetical protein n=1 Tax=Faecalispora jeddahensis TaxID=1414721 RepID=UPI0004AF5319|nr:hypothetical protein [Faecalispora jeddahensis]
MTADAFKKMMACNEPDFSYNGQDYSICWPDGKYYVTASDNPGDIDLVFHSLDDLLDRWIIQGKPLRQILPDIQFD